MKTNYSPASFTEGKTYNDRAERFLGVDLTNPMALVSQRRGIRSKNYMLTDSGRVEKRFRYTQISDEVVVLGVWKFFDDTSDRAEHTVALICVHAPHPSLRYHLKFVVPSTTDGIFYEFDETNPISDYVGVVLFVPSTPASAIAANGKLWVLTGADYVVVRVYNNALKAEKVSDSDLVYIPTVTYMGIASNADDITQVSYLTLDYPNLLTPFRKDAFLGGLGVKNSKNCPIYRLGAKCPDLDGFEIEIDTVKLKETKEKFTIDLVPVSIDDVSFATTMSVDGDLTGNELTYAKEIIDYLQSSGVTALLIRDGDTATENAISSADLNNRSFYDIAANTGGLSLKYVNPLESYTKIPSDPSNYNYNYYKAATIETGTGGGQYTNFKADVFGVIIQKSDYTEVVLFGDYRKLADDGEPNITIKYRYVSTEDFYSQINFINKCKKIVPFSNDENTMEAWVYGNSNKPCLAVHSSKFLDSADLYSKDLVYFVDQSYTEFGHSGKIVGMEMVSTNNMAVIKAETYGIEPSMFYVSSSTVSRTIVDASLYKKSDGSAILNEDVVLYDTVYSVAVSATNTDGYSLQTVDNFNGDTLFVTSSKQVVGLDIEGITGDSKRVANTRSHYIDGVIRDEIDENARLFHTNNTVFLLTNKMLYASKFISFDTETRQYQWWPLTRIEGTVIGVFILSDEEVWITTKEGKVYKMEWPDDGDYSDIERIYLDDLNHASSYQSNLLIVPSSIASTLPGYRLEDNLVEVPSDLAVVDLYPSQGYLCLTPNDVSSAKKLLSSSFIVKGTYLGNNYYYDAVPILAEHPTTGKQCFKLAPNASMVGFYITNVYMLKDNVFDETELVSFRYKPSEPIYCRPSVTIETGFSDDSGNMVFVASGPREWVYEGTSGYIYSIGTSVLYPIEPSESQMATYGYDKMYFKAKYSNSWISHSDALVASVTNKEMYFKVPTENVYAFYYGPKNSSNGYVELRLKKREGIYEFLRVVTENGGFASNTSLYGCFEVKKPIVSEFWTIRLAQEKIGYDKTIKNVTIWNDSKSPSELYVGMVTNKQLHIHEGNKVIDQGLDFDLNSIDFEHTQFNKNIVPEFYNLKRFLSNQQSFVITFYSPSSSNSVLPGIDILYKARNIARNKR